MEKKEEKKKKEDRLSWIPATVEQETDIPNDWKFRFRNKRICTCVASISEKKEAR